MCTRPDRVKNLDPAIISSNINLNENSEVLIRRYISTMYMALFNYWCAKEYYCHGKKGQGLSGEGDDFREIDFEKDMIGKGVDRDIVTLSIYRNASDHRVKNPAGNILFPNNKIHYSNLHLNNQSLVKAYYSFATLETLLKKI